MIALQYLPIDKVAIPYRFRIRLAGETFLFEAHYNSEGRFYSVDLYTSAGELIAAGEKLVYDNPLWAGIVRSGLPKVAIVPFDLANAEQEVTPGNFMVTVFPWIVTPEDLTSAA